MPEADDGGAAAPLPVRHAPDRPPPPVVADAEALQACAADLAAASGPFAVDVERAGSYRYTQRAYLIQVTRADAQIWLIDPIAAPSLAPLGEILGTDEWVLHAASQDLPSLAELDLHPPALFDTELAGRLLGLDRVGLSAMLERYLGISLAKAHSAADWSRRPLPQAWLAYAALDVELLLELRNLLAADLAAAGRDGWAAEEFEAVRRAGPPEPRVDPWRRVKGLSARSPRTLAIARLMLDNFPHIKAYWIATGVEVAQTAQWFGVDDLDGTVKLFTEVLGFTLVERVKLEDGETDLAIWLTTSTKAKPGTAKARSMSFTSAAVWFTVARA